MKLFVALVLLTAALSSLPNVVTTSCSIVVFDCLFICVSERVGRFWNPIHYLILCEELEPFGCSEGSDRAHVEKSLGWVARVDSDLFHHLVLEVRTHVICEYLEITILRASVLHNSFYYLFSFRWKQPEVVHLRLVDLDRASCFEFTIIVRHNIVIFDNGLVQNDVCCLLRSTPSEK